MSLLNQILSKKNKLKNTETIVTRPDGKKFIEVNTSSNIILTEIKSNSYGYVVDTKSDNIPAKVQEHLYLGSQDCCEESVLVQYNIRHVLSIGIDAPIKCENVSYNFIECLDLPETNLRIVLDESVPLIYNAVQKCENILVHCNAGVSRAASVVIGYLILIIGYNYSDALNVVKIVRSCIKPNVGFEKQLKCL